MTRSHPVELRLLGRFVVLRDGLEVPAAEFGGRKVRAMLRVLATRRGSVVSHDALTEMLWGRRPPADPAANLQVLANRARRALGRAELLITAPRGYALADGESLVIDTETFLAAVAAARKQGGRDALAGYVTALAGWVGEPLAEDAYAEWAAEYRDRLSQTRQLALEEAARLALDVDDVARAIEFASAASTAEPLREAAVLSLVGALAAAGDPAAALGRYELFRRSLADELGVDPSAEAQALQAELLAAGRPATTPGRSRPPALDFAVVPFVGRDAELGVLLRTAKRPDVVLLSGASGAGKSRLLDRFAARTPVILARAFLAERDEPWSLARGLVREVLAADATAAAALPTSIRAALCWLVPDLDASAGDAAVPDPESRRALLVEAAVRMLAAAAVPLVVDDLQWADASSLALLEAVLARLDVTGAVLALRPGEARERAAVAGLLARLRPTATPLRLTPFGAEEIAQIAGDRELAAELAAATDRTPMAIIEVLRALSGEGSIARSARQQWRITDPAAIRRVTEVALDGQRIAIATRVDATPEAGRDLLALLALVAREVPARVLARALARDEREVLDMLGDLGQRELARLGERGWAPAHDMVGEVVAGRLLPDERGRLHGLLARALDAAEAEPGELAGHWLGAGDTGRAAHAFRLAAEAALDAFAHDEAVTHATAGLALAPRGELCAELSEIRAAALARRGDIAGARADLRDALQVHRRGPARARLLGRLAVLASGADDLVRAAELAELALVEAGTDPAARAGALEIAAVLDMNLDRPERAEQRAAEALDIYEQVGDARGTARILDARAMATFLDGRVARGVELLDRVADLFEDSGDLVHVITPRSTAGHGLVFAGDPEGGLAHTTSALELARTLGHPEGQTYALWHTTEALAALGRVSEAIDAGAEALDVATRLGHRGWTATAWRALGIARQAAGDLGAALEAFEHSLEASAHLNLFASWAAARSALVLLAMDRPAEAVPLVERALAEGPPLGHFEARLAAAELASAQGDPDAAALAGDALRRADAVGMRQCRDRLVELAAR